MNKPTFVVVFALGIILQQECYAQVNFANYSSPCSPSLIITPTYCRLYDRTVGCSQGVNGICECNLKEDGHFDEDRQVCVGKVGAVCLLERAIGLGAKTCVDNADCFPNNDPPRDGENLGSCRCIEGFDEDGERMCTIINGAPIGTVRPTTRRPPLFPSPVPQETDPTGPVPSTTERNTGGGVSNKASNFLVLVSAVYIIIKMLLV